jgi:hypothetical protein
MHKIMISVLAVLPLGSLAACVSDDGADTSEATQSLSNGTCEILRPIGWSVAGVHCAEGGSPPSPLILNPGQQATFHSGFIFHVQGSGTLTVVCDPNGSGVWSIVSESCNAGAPI